MADKKNFIDLDNLDATKEEVPVAQEEMLQGGGSVVAKPKGNAIQDIFDRNKKMIFLFDVSGSMGEGMLPDEIEKMYHWTDEIQQQFLDKLKEEARATFANRQFGYWAKPTEAEIDAKIEEMIVEQTMNQMIAEIEDEEYDEDDIKADAKKVFDGLSQDEKDQQLFFMTYGLEPKLGTDLKMYIIRQDLQATFKIKLMKTGIQATHKRKIEVMQDAASIFITERFNKCPDAVVLAYKFDDNVELITKDCNKEGLLQAVKTKLYPAGGTSIFNAVQTAISEFKERPSGLGAHHIVLVTDAESSEGKDIEVNLQPKLKALPAVLDFIQIKGAAGGMGDFEGYRQSAEAIKRVCEATGGEYTEVNTPSEFTKKFLAAANRLLLPAKF